MKFLKSLLSDLYLSAVPPAIVVIFQGMRMTFLSEISSLDIVAHFFGGTAIALSAMIVWRRWHARGWIHADAIVRDYTVVMTALFFGTMWEWWEFWMQRWTNWIYQPTMGDTMQDLFMDTIGGLFLVLIYRLRRGESQTRP